jgi:hypothetical protein
MWGVARDTWGVAHVTRLQLLQHILERVACIRQQSSAYVCIREHT